MFMFSVTGAIGNVEFTTYLNIKIEDNMLGKVSGIGYAMSIGACALGPVIGGYSVQNYGIKDAVMLLLGIVGAMAFCSLFLLRKSRNVGMGKRAERMDSPTTGRQPAEEFRPPSIAKFLPVVALPAVSARSAGQPTGVSVVTPPRSAQQRQAGILPARTVVPNPVQTSARCGPQGFISPKKESTMVDNS